MQTVYEASNEGLEGSADRSLLQEACVSVVVYEYYGSFAIIWKYRLINDNRLNPSVGYNLITKKPKLSIKHGRVLFCATVINLKYLPHILPLYEYSVQIADRSISKSMDKARGYTRKFISP